jgi:hypothetical protein
VARVSHVHVDDDSTVVARTPFIVPNGIDPNLFDRSPLSGEARLVHWHRALVEEPRGWDETGVAGTVTYTEEDFDAFRDGGAVLVYSDIRR